MQDAPKRTSRERASPIHRVDFAKFCELAISRRRLERADSECRSLRDVESGELFVLDEDPRAAFQESA